MKYLNDFVITIDVDWASDEMILDTYSLLKERKVKSTWFFTHQTKAIDEIVKDGLVEIGIHPNFLSKSSHGANVDEVIATISSWFPDAVSTRSHGVVTSGEILFKLATKTKIRIDTSYFLPESPDIKPAIHHFPNGKICKIPFFWSDDYQLVKNEISSSFSVLDFENVHGLKVLNFHPVHIFKNTPSLKFYNESKSNTSFIRNTASSGARDYFEQAISLLVNKETFFLKDLYE